MTRTALTLALCAALFAPAALAQHSAAVPAQPGSGPAASSAAAEPGELVVLDTDIGDAADDAFALALALRSPEFRLLGVTTAWGDTALRARMVERFLALMGRQGIPVVEGVPTKADNPFTQRKWAEAQAVGADYCQYRLLSVSQLPVPQREKARYAACEKERKDGPGFILRQAAEHPGQVTLLALAPLTNIGAAIERDPAAFRQLRRVVLMGGSIARGYDGEGGKHTPAEPEWNIACDPAALRALLASGVPVEMMPMDSSQVPIPPAELDRLFKQSGPVGAELEELVREWKAAAPYPIYEMAPFDAFTVATALRPGLCPTRPMHIEVDEKGNTRSSAGAPNAEVCLKADEAGFLRLIEQRFLAH